MMFDAAEKAGSGVDKIFQGWRSQHWRSPLVNEQMRPDRVYWELPMISYIPEDSLKRLQQSFGIKFNGLNQLEVQALVTADIEGFVDNARMRQITSNHATDITRILQGLVAKNLLLQEGQARWSRYRLFPAQDLTHNGVDSLHSHVDSLHNDANLAAEVLQEIAMPARQNKRLAPKKWNKL